MPGASFGFGLMSKILFVCRLPDIEVTASTSELSLGGIEACNLELARALAARGHSVALSGRPGSDEKTDSLGLVHLGFEAAVTRKFDHLVVSNIASDFDYFDVCGAAPVYWMHNPLRFEKALRKNYVLPLVRHRPRAVFPSHDLEVRTAPYRFLSRDVIGHGIDAAFLNAACAHHESSEPVRFVFASQPHRGLDRVLRLWCQGIAPSLPHAELHLLGSASLSDIGDAPRVIRHGRLTKRQMIDVYQSATAMLYPGAEDETFCLAAAEAQCIGLPVITMGFGALRERVSHGVDGFLCKDENDFVTKARLIGTDHDLARLLGVAAQTRHANRSWDFVAGLWEDMLFGRAAMAHCFKRFSPTAES